MTIVNAIEDFLNQKKDLTATLKEITDHVANCIFSNSKDINATIRARIYQHPEKFKRLVKGIYVLKKNDTTALLIEGSGRELTEIDDNTISAIITDHPWSDTAAHKGGNRHYAEYDCFKYEQEDFDAKFRVLQDGGYLIECLPCEKDTNWKYLNNIKEMAEKAGFKYYTSMMWDKGFVANCGRTAKTMEQIIVWSKGNPRKLSTGKPYATHEMLDQRLCFPIASSKKNRNHMSEKPIELYEYLIRNFTDEYDICLDQFGGACNLLAAALNTKRFGIVYETCKQTIENAVKRFNLETYFEGDNLQQGVPAMQPVMVNVVNDFSVDNNGQYSFF